MLVRIVKRIETKVLARQRPVIFSEALYSIDDGRVALKAHALAQAIFENSRNQRPLRRFRGFSLDQGRQRHDSEHSAVVAATRLLTGCRRCKALPLFSELAHHFGGQFVRRRMAREFISGWEEESFKRLRSRREIANQG